MESFDISVNLCTYNRVEMLRSTLESLLHQETDGLDSYEIIIIDDGSTDETPSLVKETSDHSRIPIRYFREERVGVAAARNRGVKESHGEWIAFIDDDEVPEACWLKELFCEAKRSGAACVGGPVLAHFLSSPPDSKMKTTLCLLGYNKAMDSENGTMHWYDRLIHYYIPGTGNALVKRDTFDNLGAFDTTLPYGEDMDFFRRLRKAGLKISHNSQARVKHMVPASRLDPVYLKQLSKLGGQTLARLDMREWGYIALLLFSLARVSNLFFRRFPMLLRGFAKGDRGSVLDHTLSLIYSASYLNESTAIFFGVFKTRVTSSADQIKRR
jgi:glycosyltransferase involved in cell wall biosynthesis